MLNYFTLMEKHSLFCQMVLNVFWCEIIANSNKLIDELIKKMRVKVIMSMSSCISFSYNNQETNLTLHTASRDLNPFCIFV